MNKELVSVRYLAPDALTLARSAQGRVSGQDDNGWRPYAYGPSSRTAERGCAS